jgi:formate dehydrogenase major subunit
MTKTIPFTLDGKAVEAAEGETIWQVAKREGTRIPHLCHLDKVGYRPDGNCRACMVEIMASARLPRPASASRRKAWR